MLRSNVVHNALVFSTGRVDFLTNSDVQKNKVKRGDSGGKIFQILGISILGQTTVKVVDLTYVQATG